jgi:pyruvate-formate lyase-activating enzyme
MIEITDLLGDMATTQTRGWSLATVRWAGVANLEFRSGDRVLRAWIALAGTPGGAFCDTARFRVGYQGDLPGPDALLLLQDIAARLRQTETRWRPDQPVPWPTGVQRPGELVLHAGNLELRITERCNEQCPFCNSSGTVENRMADPGEIDRALERAPGLGVTMVHFTGGEPTLVADLPRWVVRAKALGLAVSIQTNGLLAWRDEFWDSFRDADGRAVLPDSLFISFHTRHPERVEALTGVGGTFANKVASVRAARARGRYVELNFVIQRGNLDELPAFPAFVLQTFGAGVPIVFSVVAPTGRSSQRDDLWPTMADLAPRLASALESARDLGVAVSIPDACGVPACVLPAWRSAFLSSRRTDDVGALTEDRVKRPSCASCVANRRCIGIWRRYAEVRGTGEFLPMGPEETG